MLLFRIDEVAKIEFPRLNEMQKSSSPKTKTRDIFSVVERGWCGYTGKYGLITECKCMTRTEVLYLPSLLCGSTKVQNIQ